MSEKKTPTVRKPRTYADTLEALRNNRAEIAKVKNRHDALIARRDALIAHAVTFPGATGGVVAKAAGTTGARVTQIAPVRKTKLQAAVGTARAMESMPSRAALRDAKKAGVLGSETEPAEDPNMSPAARKMLAELQAKTGVTPDALPGADAYAATLAEAAAPTSARTARVLPGIGDTPITVEPGEASRRKWTPTKPYLTAIAHPSGVVCFKGETRRVPVADRSAGAWLAVLPPEIRRVVFVGGFLWHDADSTDTMIGDVRRWLTAPLPEGWTHGKHFIHARHPVARFEFTGEGQRRSVEFQHLGTWVPGSEEEDVRTVRQAFIYLRDTLRSRWKSDSVELLGSPKTLGQDLWERTIPKGVEYPIMSPELRELIHTTSGQGRFELRTPPAVPAQLPALHNFDGTFAYAGLTWGMAVGAPSRITSAAYESANLRQQEKWVRGRGRWHVRATVPADWSHVGILPTSGISGWEYPSEPGRTFTSWASGPEVWLAIRKGWHVEILDGITWEEGKPLNLWRDRLVESWHALRGLSQMAGPGYGQAAALAAKMIRSILLFTIGGFHSMGAAQKGVAATEAEVPDNAFRAEERDGMWAWEAERDSSATTSALHPEWSAEVYGRMRARLLDGPGGGALSLPAESVIAFRADAMMLTVDPGWTNPDNVPGKFRRKGSLYTPVAAPTTEAELMALRDQMEEA